MPPSKRPRGLKASAKDAKSSSTSTTKAAAIATGLGTQTTSSSSSDEASALTIPDMYELRTYVLTLLNTGNEEDEEEAMAVLRGILHACDAIVKLACRVTNKTSTEWFEHNNSSHRKENEQDVVGDEDDEDTRMFNALGFATRCAPAHIAYLQGFALFKMGNLLHEQAIQADQDEQRPASKRQKVERGEPVSKEEWLERAVDRFQMCVQWWKDEKVEHRHVAVELYDCALHLANAISAICSLLSTLVVGMEESRARQFALPFLVKHKIALDNNHDTAFNNAHENLLVRMKTVLRKGTAQDNLYAYTHTDQASFSSPSYSTERGDIVPDILDAIKSYTETLDSYPQSTSSELLQGLVWVLERGLEGGKVHFTGAATNSTTTTPTAATTKTTTAAANVSDERADRQRKLDILVAISHVQLALFWNLDDAVENKYRPESEDDDDDEDEGEDGEEDEDEDLVLLPDDAEDVEGAREAGKKSVRCLKDSIALIEELDPNPSESDSELGSLWESQQYKLIEALYALWSLYNPKDKQGASLQKEAKEKEKAMEELSRRRKEGKLKDVVV